jgi:hypothetical protein
MAAEESGAYRDFHNLSYLEYAYIQLGCYRDAQHTVDIIAAQYRELPDKKTAPDTPELQSRHVRGRTIYAVPDPVVYGYFDMLASDGCGIWPQGRRPRLPRYGGTGK